MDLHLKDRVVLITGATGGIGQALTRAFAAEGCKLAISSTSQAKLDAFTPSLGLDEGHLKTFIVDVTKEEQVKAFVDGAHAAYGRLDVLVINAGYEGKVEMIQDVQKETYDKVFGVNLYGPLYCMKYAAPYMIAQKQGGDGDDRVQRQLYRQRGHERLLRLQARCGRPGQERRDGAGAPGHPLQLHLPRRGGHPP